MWYNIYIKSVFHILFLDQDGNSAVLFICKNWSIMELTQIISFVGLFLASNGLWAFLTKVHENHRKDKVENPVEQLNKKFDSVQKDVKELAESLNKNSEVTMSHARERLNNLCQKYIEMGYIPQEEFQAFVLLGESYINAGGNHGFDELFQYVINNFKVVSKSHKNTSEKP